MPLKIFPADLLDFSMRELTSLLSDTQIQEIYKFRPGKWIH